MGLNFFLSITTDVLSDIVGGILGFIVKAIFFVVKTLLYDFFLNQVFPFVLRFLYSILIRTPLYVINVLIIGFRFFANGLSSALLGMSINPDGSINSSFNLVTPIGFIVMTVFVISLMLFFVNFLLSYGEKTAVDKTGNPMNAQIRRFKYLKWPLLMVACLILGPTLLLMCDWLMTMLVARSTGSKSVTLTAADINDANKLYQEMLTMKNNLATFFATNNQLGQDLKDYANYLALQSELASKLSLGVCTPAELANIETVIGTSLLDGFLDSDATFALEGAISNTLNYYNNLDKYINTNFATDLSVVRNAIDGMTVGTYFSDAAAEKLQLVYSNLLDFKKDLTSYESNLKKLVNAGILISTGYNTVSLAKTNSALFLAPITALTIPNEVKTAFSDLVSKGNINGISTTSFITGEINVVYNSIRTNVNMTKSIYNTDSYYNHVMFGTNEIRNINYFIKKTEANSHVIIFSSDYVPKVLYQVISGDPNAGNWDSENNYYMVETHANLLQWCIGVIFIFGMIMIVYTYLVAAIKRSFYLFFYWVLGFLYLSNAITNEKAVKTWTRMFIGKWWCIFALYGLFELVTAVIPFCIPVLDAGLGQNQGFIYGDANLLVIVGKVLLMESAYQCVYIIWNKYQGTFGVQEEAFQMQKSQTFTEGLQTFNRAIDTASEAASQVGSTVAKPYTLTKDINATKDFWHDIEKDKLNKNKATLDDCKTQWTAGDNKHTPNIDPKKKNLGPTGATEDRAQQNMRERNDPISGTTGKQGLTEKRRKFLPAAVFGQPRKETKKAKDPPSASEKITAAATDKLKGAASKASNFSVGGHGGGLSSSGSTLDDGDGGSDPNSGGGE